MKFKLVFHNRHGSGTFQQNRSVVEGETTQDGLFFRATVEATLDMITKFTTLHASVTWEAK